MSAIRLVSDVPGRRRLARVDRELAATAAVAAVVSTLAFLYYRSAGLTLVFGDGLSRLNTARRVFDSLDPGLVQLGAIWPPAPQIAMLPFIWIDPLWRSGLAGSLPSMVEFIATGVYLYALGRRLTRRSLGGVIACAVYVSNPSVLYVQSIQLSEPLMLLALSASAYHLAGWLDDESNFSLFAAAVWVFIGTMTRYEAWTLVVAGGVIVVATTYARYRDGARSRGLGLIFVVPAAYGILLWLVYAAVIFGDPLVFAHGAGTAREHADEVAKYGNLITKWNLEQTIRTYGWDLIDVAGIPALLLAGIGLTAGAAMRLPLRRFTIVGFLLMPAGFTLVSIFAGSAVLSTPHTGPFSDTRYGLLSIPAVAIAAAFPAALGRAAGVATLALILLVASFSYGLGPRYGGVHAVDADSWISANYPLLAGLQPIVVADALSNSSELSAKEAARWLAGHRDGRERVLISQLANDEFMFYSGLQLSDYIFEGMQPYWDDELRAPGTWSTWIVVREGYFRDQVALKDAALLSASPRYERAFHNDHYTIYRVNSGVGAPAGASACGAGLAAVKLAASPVPGDGARPGARLDVTNEGDTPVSGVVLGFTVTQGAQSVSRIDFGNGQPWLVDGSAAGTLYFAGDLVPGERRQVTLRATPSPGGAPAGGDATIRIEARAGQLGCLSDSGPGASTTLAR